MGWTWGVSGSGGPGVVARGAGLQDVPIGVKIEACEGEAQGLAFGGVWRPERS